MAEDFPVVSGEVVTETQINSKKYLVKTTKPTDDEGLIGDVCFVIE